MVMVVNDEWGMGNGEWWMVTDGWCADTSLLSGFAMLFKVLQE